MIKLTIFRYMLMKLKYSQVKTHPKMRYTDFVFWLFLNTIIKLYSKMFIYSLFLNILNIFYTLDFVLYLFNFLVKYGSEVCCSYVN